MIEYGLIIIPMEGKNAPPRPMNPIIDEQSIHFSGSLSRLDFVEIIFDINKQEPENNEQMTKNRKIKYPIFALT